MGWARGTHGRGEKMEKFWWESPKERDHWEDRQRRWEDGSEWILGKQTGGWGSEWIQLAQDSARRRHLVNMANLRVLAPRIWSVSKFACFCVLLQTLAWCGQRVHTPETAADERLLLLLLGHCCYCYYYYYYCCCYHHHLSIMIRCFSVTRLYNVE
jgi:hypothetical protein